MLTNNLPISMQRKATATAHPLEPYPIRLITLHTLLFFATRAERECPLLSVCGPFLKSVMQKYYNSFVADNA